MKKKALLAVATALTMLVSFAPAHAANANTTHAAKKQEATTKVVQAADYKEMAKKVGLDPSTVVGGARILFNADGTVQPNAIGTEEWGGNEFFLQNVSAGETTGNYFAKDKATGPAPFSMQYSTKLSSEVSAEISGELGIDGAKIASKLGARYVIDQTVTRTYGPVNIPAGKTYTFYAFPLYNYYTYELWEDDVWYDDYIGTYWYKEPTGIYVTWQDTTGW